MKNSCTHWDSNTGPTAYEYLLSVVLLVEISIEYLNIDPILPEFAIITYLVSYRRSIEIWRVCKIYGRRGGAEPSIDFTNPPYFYRPSVTDQISVLFCRGP